MKRGRCLKKVDALPSRVRSTAYKPILKAFLELGCDIAEIDQAKFGGQALFSIYSGFYNKIRRMKAGGVEMPVRIVMRSGKLFLLKEEVKED